MRDNLEALIRLHNFRVDEKRREIAGIITIIVDLEKQTNELDNRAHGERSVAEHSPNLAGVLFGNYVAQYLFKKEQFEVAIKELEAKLQAAQDELKDEFKELKGVEIAQETRDQFQRLERTRAEQNILDENGLDSYRRRIGS